MWARRYGDSAPGWPTVMVQLGGQAADHVRDVQGVAEDHQVGQQGVELDQLLLLSGVVVGQHPRRSQPLELWIGSAFDRRHLPAQT